MKRAFLGALLFFASIYVAICGYMFFAQRTLQYRPDPTRVEPRSAGLSQAEEISLKSSDGENLVAWWISPRGDRQPVYLYLHGNAGNLARRSGRFLRLSQNGAGVLAVSYRGYGGSSGSPSEAGFHRDAQAAYQWLRQRIAPERIVVFGESIGTGVAIKLAADEAAAALALDSPYSSTLAIAQERYAWLPVRLLMLDQFRSDLQAPRITLPAFIVHCRGDRTVPLKFGEQLASLIRAPLHYEKIDSICHPAPYNQFMDAMEHFLARHGLPRQQQ